MKQGVEDLLIWQRAMELAVVIYAQTASPGFDKDRDFRSQIRRSAVSIPSNLAEGYEKGTFRDSIKFYYIAKGSAGELRTQCLLAGRVGHLASEAAERAADECSQISRMIMSFIQKTKGRDAPRPKPGH
jgi:four helix bundle protein